MQALSDHGAQYRRILLWDRDHGAPKKIAAAESAVAESLLHEQCPRVYEELPIPLEGILEAREVLSCAIRLQAIARPAFANSPSNEENPAVQIKRTRSFDNRQHLL